MRVCVIADDEVMGSRIRHALSVDREFATEETVRLDRAESHLARGKPDVVVFATGREVSAAVSTVARLRDMTTGQLLAVGPVADSRLVLGILRGGAVDYVDDAAVESELVPALARLKFGRGTRAVPARFYAVLGPSGGSGASLVAANLALAMAKTQETCLLVDLKLRSGDLAALFDLKPSHTIQDLCRDVARIDRDLFVQTLSKLPAGVSLLPSPRSFEVAISSQALARVFELGSVLFPRIIADFDPTLPDESIEALRLADSILLVLRLEFNSLRNAKTTLDHLERRGVDPKRILLISNRVGQPKEISASKVEEALGRKFFAKLPEDPKTALGSQNNGVPALTGCPSSRLSKALISLATVLNALPASSSGGT